MENADMSDGGAGSVGASPVRPPRLPADPGAGGRGGPEVVRAEGLSFGYPGRTVLRGVDLAVRAGELVALIGLNGCGKSTFLKLAAGLLTPSGGRVLLDGDDVTRLPRRTAARRV